MISRSYVSTNFITGLRSIAVLMVFLIHSGGEIFRNNLSFGDRMVDLGKYGVDIFFLISGFTIFYQFFEKKYLLKDFLLLRIMRISIPYFPILITIYIYTLLGNSLTSFWAIKFNDGDLSFINLFLHMVYMSFVDVKYANTIIGVEWTLSIEVFYYFLLGYMIYVLRQFQTLKSTIIYFSLFLIISIVFLFIGKILDQSLFISWLPFRYGYMFLLGGTGYFFRKKIQVLFSKTTLNKLSNIVLVLAVGIFIIFHTYNAIPSSSLLNELFFSLWTFMIIVFIQDSAKLSIIFTNKISIFIGSLSFSFYLIHLSIVKIINSIGIEDDGFKFLSALFTVLILSSVYYYIFEKSVYQGLKKLYKRKNI